MLSFMDNPLSLLEYITISKPKENISEKDWLNEILLRGQGSPVKISNDVNLELAAKTVVLLRPVSQEIVMEMDDGSLLTISNNQTEESLRSQVPKFVAVKMTDKSKLPKLALDLEEIWKKTEGETFSRVKQSVKKLEPKLETSFLTEIKASEECKPLVLVLISALSGKSEVLHLIIGGKTIRLW